MAPTYPTNWTDTSTNSTDWTTTSTVSTNWEDDDPSSGFILLQNGSILLNQSSGDMELQ